MERECCMRAVRMAPLHLCDIYALVLGGRVRVCATNVAGFQGYSVHAPNDADFTRMYAWVCSEMSTASVVIADYPEMRVNVVDYPEADSLATVVLDYLVLLTDRRVIRYDP